MEAEPMEDHDGDGIAHRTLGNLIRIARNAAGQSQEAVATELGKRKQLISSAERGLHVPPLDLVIRLHEFLYRGSREERAASLGLWIARWIEARTARSAIGPEERATLREMLALVEGVVTPRHPARVETRPFISLEDFPTAFQPLTIITGDRRETSGPRLSLADLFAYSVSITDVTFLPLLPAMDPPPKIRSDKLAVVMHEDFLKAEFGRSNLLIIGSPAVNWDARMINRQSLFRFDIDAKWAEWDEALRKRPELQDEQVLRYFWTIMQMREEAEEKARKLDDRAVQEELNPRNSPETAQLLAEALDASHEVLQEFRLRYIMSKFRKTGILDPADGLIHGEVTRDNNDFGLISLAPNLFDPTGRYVAIIVAGIHGPGTTHALRLLLEEPADFKDHPFGGVLEFVLPRFSDWSYRFQRVSWEWQTRSYDLNMLQERFTQAEAQDQRDRTESLKRYAPSEIAACSRFISRLVEGVPVA
jgi:transcriptional regulator with XRE-family HTH domain